MRRRTAMALAAALSLVALVAAPALAAPYGSFNRPEDTWKVAETKHFRFYFTEDTPDTAAYLIRIADDTFERLNEFYGYEPPDKITVTVVGYTSYGNGFADSLRNRITIFPSPPDFHVRSRVHWLDNVFTHELSHILSLNAANPWGPRAPLVLTTGVVRADHAQGLLRYPVHGRNQPHWLIEGVAQFDSHMLGRDAFDENRGAYQRAAWEDRLFFPLGKLAFFGGEQWYNTGLSFLLYLEERFGEGTVHRILRHSGETYFFHFDALFEDTLGVPLATLERDYARRIRAEFEGHLDAVHGGLYDGKPLVFEEQEETYRELTPSQRDYQREAYRSGPQRYEDGWLYFHQGTGIQRAHFDPKTRQLSDTEGVAEGFAFAPHTKDSFFVLRQDNESPSLLPSFYRPEFESATLFLVERTDTGERDEDGKPVYDTDERPVRAEARLMDFDVCPRRAELAGVYNDGDGNLTLALMRFDDFGTPDVALRDEPPRFPLKPLPFEEVRSPRYGPDCKRLYFSRRVGDDHDVFALVLDTGEVEVVSATEAFELYPEPTKDGVYFVSARDGTMNVYFRPNGGDRLVQITEAITGHHNPIASPDGVFFARLTGTGFHTHYQPHTWTPGVELPLGPDKQVPRPAPAAPAPSHTEDYAPFSSDDLLSPTLVPLLDLQLDTQRTFGQQLEIQAGLELYLEDQLRTHSLYFRGFVGSRSSFWVGYENSMTPLTLRARAGMTQTRGLYVYENAGSSFEHVTDYRWGFLYGSAGLPLDLFYTVRLEAETIRDVSSTLGARERPFDWLEPRYGREMFGVAVSYSGLDRSDPTFRDRDVNRRGYREYELRLHYAVEEIHPLLGELDETIDAGREPYFRVELEHTEYIALPDLMGGFFDHTLQIDVSLGYISRDIRFLPFIGGGRLYSLTSPELNTSVGFVGYSFYAVRGETLANVGITYRFPLARGLSLDWGPLFLEDIYAQVFTSWGNIWSFGDDGERQIPFVDRARNGQYVLGDVGIDVRLLHFFQEVEGNVGTTARLVYRLVPFSRCPDEGDDDAPECLSVDGQRGLVFYLILGGGF